MNPPTILRFAALLLVAQATLFADVVRPPRFGPYLEQGIVFETSPAGWNYLPPFSSYTFQAGWIEPLTGKTQGLLCGGYLETQAHATISPFQEDIGTTFNFSPIRVFEIGLGYNRLVFPKTLVGFNRDSTSPHGLPHRDRWSAKHILTNETKHIAGADIFTMQVNATFQIGRLQMHGGAYRKLWDVDVEEQEILYEYSSNLLIRKRDRVNSLYGQAFFNMEPYLNVLGFTLRGFTIRDQFWWASQTKLSQHLVSGGFSGLRWGQNTNGRYRGLDGMIGYWIEQPQVDDQNFIEKLRIHLNWLWNIQVLKNGD